MCSWGYDRDRSRHLAGKCCQSGGGRPSGPRGVGPSRAPARPGGWVSARASVDHGGGQRRFALARNAHVVSLKPILNAVAPAAQGLCGRGRGARAVTRAGVAVRSCSCCNIGSSMYASYGLWSPTKKMEKRNE